MSELTHVMTWVKSDALFRAVLLRDNHIMKSLKDFKICSCGKCHIVLNETAREWPDTDLVIFECSDCSSTLAIKKENIVEHVC